MNTDLKNFSRDELVDGVINLVGEERRIGLEIIEYLQEIERRKIYAEMGYDGLFTFCVKHLKYSEPQASRRISAMWAVRELPELKSEIQSGKLNVTTVAQVQSHLRREKLKGKTSTHEQKLELFGSLQGQSSKAIKATLAELSGDASCLKLSLYLDPEMEKAWEEIKNLSAHSTRGQTDAILKMLMKEWLKRHHPLREVRAPNNKPLSQKADSDTYVSGEAMR